MLELANISKSYDDFHLKDISFRVQKGSYFVLLGPSGAGKTQVLEIVSGLVSPDSGKITAEGRDITHLDSRYRPVGIVFQDLAVFPHLNVEKNIAYGLKRSKLSQAEISRRVEEAAAGMSISHLLGRRPETLSGGELQRVALARTLVRQPHYLLLDEPMASLDVNLRQDLFSLLKDLHRHGQTILHVTHDFEESLVLATHIGVMNEGKMIQTATADEVFHRPGSEFVARFTGIKNYFPAVLRNSSGRQVATLSNGLDIRIITDQPDGNGFVLIPGEEILLSAQPLVSSATNQLKGKVKEVFKAPYGEEVLVDAGLLFYIKITHESLEKLHIEPGKEVWLSFKASGVRFIRA
jgi:molybdopterin-binding protein